jgi:hypothetical protein
VVEEGDVLQRFTREEFWALVQRVAGRTEHVGQRTSDRAELGPEEMRAAYRCFRELLAPLQDRIQHWERVTGKRLPCDDAAFDDLTAHIIALGQEEYDRVMANPELSFERALRGDFRAESFAYWLP